MKSRTPDPSLSLYVLDERVVAQTRWQRVQQLTRSLRLREQAGDHEGAALAAAWLRDEAAA